MIVWGGFTGTSGTELNTGGMYDPATDTWTPTSTVGAPTARTSHTAVWTGSKMIVWGGDAGSIEDTGGVYDPATDTWTSTSMAGAPSPRYEHTAVWTGSKMIVWGGSTGQSGTELDTGGIYDPATDTWTPTSTVNAPAGRYFHTAVWTGTKMIVWGGLTSDATSGTGGIYDPATDTWTPTSTVGAPTSDGFHSAVWTGSRMIVWGGADETGYLDVGGIYNPASDTWTPTSTVNAPTARRAHTAVWSGPNMIVWGGADNFAKDTGGIYDPRNDTWTATTSVGAPTARYYHTAVWTGSKMIVWGGFDDGGNPLASGGVYSPDPSVVGEWSSYVLWPVNATHAALLPTGNLFFWRDESSYLWDPATEVVTATPEAGYDAFCAGHAFIGDGRLFVTGGSIEATPIGPEHGSNAKGLREASYYDPFSNAWSQLPLMNAGRWYPTNTTLPNGDVLTISGKNQTGGYNKLPQVWQVASGTWRSLTGVVRSSATEELLSLYPWMFVAPNGKVFMAGPKQVTRYLDTTGIGSWSLPVSSSNFGQRARGSSVMYDDGKVLIVGGLLLNNVHPTETAEVIDLQGDATWRYVAPMAERRANANATLLPDGKVLVTGGHKGIGNSDPTQPVYLAEMWDPQTETWSSMASMAIYHGYHSTAILLPDARVVTAGGDFADPSGDNREIYSPPYLFKGPRPTIISAPAAVGYGQTFFVETPDAASITNVNWLALGATTHAFNMGQRINRLTFSQAQGGLDVTAPSSGNLCPPGYYMLFILTNDGVPSVARFIQIG